MINGRIKMESDDKRLGDDSIKPAESSEFD